MAGMIPDLDIWRSANLLVKHHGQDAPVQAAMRADAIQTLEDVLSQLKGQADPEPSK